MTGVLHALETINLVAASCHVIMVSFAAGYEFWMYVNGGGPR